MNTNPVIERAVEQVRRERARTGRELEKLDLALGKLTTIGRGTMPHPMRGGRRRRMTAAGRRAISLAQKARWAKVKRDKARAA